MHLQSVRRRWVGVVVSARSPSGLRVLTNPFVVAVPGGVNARTRLRPTPTEEAALERIGTHLGALYRETLVSRVGLGRVDAKAQSTWRTARKQSLTAQTSARWAGAITRTAVDSYRSGVRGLLAEAKTLRAATTTISARLAAPVAGSVPGARRPVRGYASTAERFEKSRRQAGLSDRLSAVERCLAAGAPRIVVGGGRLWHARHHLAQAGLSEQQWSQRWSDHRMFLTADGEGGQVGGNQTIRVDADDRLTLKVPGALVATLGSHLTLARPLSLETHRGEQWRERILARQALTYDITRDRRGRWYLDASWTYPSTPLPSLETLRTQPTLGVDLNAGHLDAAVIDEHGNVIGTPVRLGLDLAGRSTAGRDAQLRHAVTRLIHLARANGCASVSIEDLNFAEARESGRESMGRGRRGKTFRRTVAGIPTTRFRERLVAMAATAGITVIAVDPAYTSRWAKEHWLTPLRASDSTVDGHRAAAVVIGRRGMGHRARRKPFGPPARRRTRPGQSSGTAGPGAQHSRARATAAPRTLDVAGASDTSTRVRAASTVRAAPLLGREPTRG